MRILRIFWPALIYLLSFILYALAVRDFYNNPGSDTLFRFYVPCLIANYFVLPGIALVQLGYGIYLAVRKKQRKYRLHIYAALSVVVLLIAFIGYLRAGNIATV